MRVATSQDTDLSTNLRPNFLESLSTLFLLEVCGFESRINLDDAKAPLNAYVDGCLDTGREPEEIFADFRECERISQSFRDDFRRCRIGPGTDERNRR